MTIALIVLSSILLLLVVGLLFKKDFREDVLKSTADNEAEFKGFKVRGALFWVIYALTALGTIFLATEQDSENNKPSDCKPQIVASDPNTDWVALDMASGTPISFQFGCPDNLGRVDHTARNKLNLDLKLDPSLKIKTANSEFEFGTITPSSLSQLGLTNDLSFKSYLEISYDLTLSPFKSIRAQDRFYDWNTYENLPFTISVEFTTARQLHIVIEAKDKTDALLVPALSLTDKWNRVLRVQNKIYVVRLRSRDLDPGNNTPEHANFQVVEFSGATMNIEENTQS